jgi:hypothetical protein
MPIWQAMKIKELAARQALAAQIWCGVRWPLHHEKA